MAPLQESIQAQVSRHPEAPALRPLRLVLTLLPLPLPLQEQDLRRAYTEVAAAHRQQLCQLEFARKMLEKVRGGCPLRSPARRPGPAVFFYPAALGFYVPPVLSPQQLLQTGPHLSVRPWRCHSGQSQLSHWAVPQCRPEKIPTKSSSALGSSYSGWARGHLGPLPGGPGARSSP